MARDGFDFDRLSRRWDPTNWSLTVGRLWGIRIRIHFLFILLPAFMFLRGLTSVGIDHALYFVLPCVVILLAIVFLHELGHCFGCRMVGGAADDVLMWPLGGLAFTQPPHHPTARLVTTSAGPAVNVVLCLILLPVLWFGNVELGSLLNPFARELPHAASTGVWYAAITFKISYWLLLFNLLPIFPFDGGRLLHELLWFKVGSYSATMIATMVGLVGAAILALVGAWTRELLLIVIALFAAGESWMARKNAETMGELPENEFGYDFSQGYTSLERSMHRTRPGRQAFPSFRQTFVRWTQRRRELSDAQLEAELDRILEKIHVEGMVSLSRAERKTLKLASKKRHH